MADQKTSLSPLDFTQYPNIDSDPTQMQKNIDTQNKAYDDLQQRYSQPNWFKFAAGMLKPQLGGFFASLGSGAEALGENLEQQKAMALPIAQARAQLSAQQYMLDRRNKSNQILEQYHSQHPEVSGYSADIIRQASEQDPNNPAVVSAIKNIELNNKQYEIARQGLQDQYAAGRISKDEYTQRIADLSGQLNQPLEKNVGTIASKNQPDQTVPAKIGLDTDAFLGASHQLSGLQPGQKTKSTATGPGDLLESTINDLKARHNLPDGYGTDPKITQQYEQALLQDNAKALNSGKLDNSALNHRALWWFGSGDGVKLLNADNTTKLGDVLSDKVLSSNNLNKNSTVGALKSRISGELYDKGIEPTAIVGGQPTNQKQEFLTLEQSGLTGPQAQEMVAKSASEREAMFANKFNHIVTSYDPNVTNARSANLKRAYDLMHGKDAQQVQEAMGQLWKDKGFVNAVEGVINDGLNLSISPGLSASFGLNLNDALTRAKVDPAIRTKLLEINRIIMQDAQSDFREGAKNLGGGHINQSEFQSLRNQIPSTDNPAPLLSQWIMKRRAENKLNASLYGATQQYLKDTNNDPKYSHSNFFKSTYSPYQNALDSYKSDYKNALNSIGE